MSKVFPIYKFDLLNNIIPIQFYNPFEKSNWQICSQQLLTINIKNMSKAGSPKTIKKSRDNTEYQQSQIGDVQQLPSSFKNKLQIEQIQITLKRSFEKRRNIRQRTLNNNYLQESPVRPNQKTINNNLVLDQNSQVEKNIKDTNKSNTKVAQLSSAVDLSIISEKANESKIISQPSKINISKVSFSSKPKTTFEKWVNSRESATSSKRQKSFSLSSICNHSINPGLHSFMNDSINIHTMKGSNSAVSFKECFQRKISTLNNPITNFGQLLNDFSKSKSRDKSQEKNSAVKKILKIQTLLASKGVNICKKIYQVRQKQNKNLRTRTIRINEKIS